MPLSNNHSFALKFYRTSVIVVGVAVIAVAVYKLWSSAFDWQIAALAVLTALVASQISIKFSKDNNNNITLADTFIFLALLLWGAPAAILMAATESIASTVKTQNRSFVAYLFNMSAATIGTWITSITLSTYFNDPIKLVSELPLSTFALAICVMGLTQYFAVSSILAIMQFLHLPSRQSWRTWMKQYYLWII